MNGCDCTSAFNKQPSKLLHLIANHSDVAQNYYQSCREKLSRLWDDTGCKLNSIGFHNKTAKFVGMKVNYYFHSNISAKLVGQRRKK